MAVLMQTMVPSEVSFVLHTESTQSDTPGTCLTAEVAVGLGETLASGTRGTPWRLEVDKTTGLTSTTAFASIGTALVMDAGGSSVKTEAVDYSSNALSVDPAARAALGAKLRDAGVALETAYGSAQDVEGGIVDGEVYIVQSRPQPQ
jgi:phosphoglucan,water dikinase